MSENSRQSLCLNGPIEVRRDVLVTFFTKHCTRHLLISHSVGVWWKGPSTGGS